MRVDHHLWHPLLVMPTQGDWLIEVPVESERRVPRDWLRICGTKKVGYECLVSMRTTPLHALLICAFAHHRVDIQHPSSTCVSLYSLLSKSASSRRFFLFSHPQMSSPSRTRRRSAGPTRLRCTRA